MADPIDELADLRADYAKLGKRLDAAFGSEAASLSRERRMIRQRLNELEQVDAGTVLDEVAERRESKAIVARVPARRRQSR